MWKTVFLDSVPYLEVLPLLCTWLLQKEIVLLSEVTVNEAEEADQMQ